METVGERVRRVREAQDMSRDTLAGLIGKKYSYVAELERGGMKGSTRLHAIATALGVRVEWLETGRGAQKPSDKSEPLSHRENLSRAMRPDAVKMAAAYQAAVIYGDHAKKVLFFTDARHMEFVCALYELLAQGEGVLPGERHAEAMLAFAEQLPQLTGESTNVVPKQQHRARRR